MLETKMTLSIVMPVFNHPEWVEIMVDSILANSFVDWELWAVDDGSSEENVKAFVEYFAKDERMHYLHRNREPKGPQTCRNIGLENARGEFIIFFDSDDQVFPFTLKKRVEALRSREDLDFMVFPSGVLFNGNFSVLGQRQAYGFPVFRDDLQSFARRVLPFVVWNNIYRTKSLRESEILWDVNLKSLQDSDFNVQALLKGLKYEYCNTSADFAYRINANSDSVSKKMKSDEHKQSIPYASEKFFQCYQAHYGYRYDFSLYCGVLYLYNSLMSDGITSDLAYGMVDVVKRYSSFWGMLLSWQVRCTQMLARFMAAKKARQIPMVLFLVNYIFCMRRKQQRITRLYQKN